MNRLVLSLCTSLLIVACSQENGKPELVITPGDIKEPLIKANKLRLEKEDVVIANYIKRRNWDMQVTQTGLRYLIYEKGDGKNPKLGQSAVINYQVSLLDGTVCYSSDSLGTKAFTIGKGEIENGIDEGILLLGIGDKAKFILPSHLGYGFTGDDDKIPSHAVLVYNVELIDIK